MHNTRCLFAAVVIAMPSLAVAQRPTAPIPFAIQAVSADSIYLGDASPSPDGRWVVMTGRTAAWESIFIAPEGGTPREVTPRTDGAANPVWFSDGKRIAYRSNRVSGVVVADFDPVSVRLSAPRRVTIESSGSFDVSPDGRWITYVTMDGPAGARESVIKIVPSTGGNARVVYRVTPGQLTTPRFSRDGAEIYFTAMRFHLNGPREVMRVPTAGGSASLVARGSTKQPVWNVYADPRHDRIIHRDGARLILTNLRGDTLAIVPEVGTNTTTRMAFSTDSRYLYVKRDDSRSVIRAQSLGDAPSRDLSDDSRYFWPVGWSADSKRVFYTPQEPDELHSVNIDGSDRRVVRFAPLMPPRDTSRISIASVSGDGRHWLLYQRTAFPNVRRAYLYDGQTRVLRHLSDSLTMNLAGPGGNYLNYRQELDGFAYVHGVGSPRTQPPRGLGAAPSAREIRLVAMDGATRVLRRIPVEMAQASGFSLSGDRLAWRIVQGDSTVLYVARGTEPPKRVWAWAGTIWETAWSHDGKTIVAVGPTTEGGQERSIAHFIAVDATGNGRLAGRSATFAGTYWDLYWTADDKALIAIDGTGAYATPLIRIPVNGAPVTTIIRGGEMTFWNHFLSPDGRYTLLPREVAKGSTVWKVDLREAEAAYRQRGRGR